MSAKVFKIDAYRKRRVLEDLERKGFIKIIKDEEYLKLYGYTKAIFVYTKEKEIQDLVRLMIHALPETEKE